MREPRTFDCTLLHILQIWVWLCMDEKNWPQIRYCGSVEKMTDFAGQNKYTIAWAIPMTVEASGFPHRRLVSSPANWIFEASLIDVAFQALIYFPILAGFSKKKTCYIIYVTYPKNIHLIAEHVLFMSCFIIGSWMILGYLGGQIDKTAILLLVAYQRPAPGIPMPGQFWFIQKSLGTVDGNSHWMSNHG